MANLEIRKKTNRTWVHVDSLLGNFILSKFYFTEDGTKFQIVEQGESKRRIYDISNITIYDDSLGGTAETFVSIADLSIRLEQLFYPAFNNISTAPLTNNDPLATHLKGNYDIVTNNPNLIDGIGQVGNEYICVTAGTRDFGSGNIEVKENDVLAYSGSIYFLKVNNNQNDLVGSQFKGYFNALLNHPVLANGFGANGDYYKVTTAGSPDFGAGIVDLPLNCFIYYDGYSGIWDLWFRESTPGSTPIASEVDSGTVKTNVTVADPKVYLVEEVDALVQQAIGGQLSYFFFKTVSDVAGYYKMLLNPSTGAAQDITVLNCTGTTTIANFVTEPSAPNKTYIPKGYFRSTIHAKKAGAGNATVFYEVYKRDLAGTETLIGTSPVSDTNLTTSILEYRLEIYVPTQVPLLATDRIVYRARTVVASGTPDVGIYFEDSYLTGLDVPSYIVSVTEIPDASETVAGKVSVGTQTFGGNKKIVGESSTVGNALEVQNLAHTVIAKVSNEGDSYFNNVRIGTGKGNISTNTVLALDGLLANTTGANNVSVGKNSLKANTTGGSNVGVGSDSLLTNTIGTNNLAIGTASLRANTSGSNNVGLGSSSLVLNTTGGNNMAIGVNSLGSNTTGTSCVAIGNEALYLNTTALYNVAIGDSALRQIITGSNNVGVGYRAGRLTSTSGVNNSGDNSVFLGYDTRPLADSQTNQIVVGSGSIGAGSNTVTLGNTSITKTVLRGVIAHSTSYTVSTLPTGVLGDTAHVTDAVLPTYLGALTGGGSVACPVFFNGTIWVSH